MAGQDFNPDQFLAETAPQASFDPDAFLRETSPRTQVEPDVSLGEYAGALGRGAAQGASLGFADELAGAGKTAMQYLSDQMYGKRPKSIDDMVAEYKRNRDEYRAGDIAAKEKHPWLYNGGQLGGSVATAFIPWMGALNVSKGATGLNFLAQSVGKGALQGALAGAGEANELSDVPEQAERGAKWGAAMGALVPAVNKVAGAVGDKLRPKKLASTMLGTSEDAVERYMKNPEAVMNAPTVEESVGNVKSTLGKLREEMLAGSKQSRADLMEEGVQHFYGSEIGRFYQNAADAIKRKAEGVLTPDEAATVAMLEKQAEPWMQKGIASKKFSAERVKDLIQNIDRKTEGAYSTHPADFNGPDIRQMVGVRSNMNQELRTRAPQYGQTMDEVSRQKELLDEVGGLFRTDQGLANTLNRVRRGRAPFAEQSLEKLDKEFGQSTVEDLRNALARESFEKGAAGPGGSRNVNLYKDIFGDLLHKIPGGKAIGGAIGATVDKYGPSIGKDMIDTTMQIKSLLNSVPGVQTLGKYAAPLAAAAKRGNQSLAATHFILSQTDPGYKRILDQQQPTSEQKLNQ